MLRKTNDKVVQAAKRNKVGPPGEKGQSLVEMAIITPLLLLLFIGVVEVGWAIRGYVVLANADREATRFAARGLYLDFAQNERQNVGYEWVLAHTIDGGNDVGGIRRSCDGPRIGLDQDIDVSGVSDEDRIRERRGDSGARTGFDGGAAGATVAL